MTPAGWSPESRAALLEAGCLHSTIVYGQLHSERLSLAITIVNEAACWIYLDCIKAHADGEQGFSIS